MPKTSIPKPRTRTIKLDNREIKAIGGETAFWNDFYHLAMTMSFLRFLATTLALYVGINVIFALLYAVDEGSVANVAAPRFLNLFFFATEAFTTVGFGEMHPATAWGHVVYALQGFSALLLTAALTGLIFARFSKPRARMIFADNPVISKHDGKTHLMLRVANARHNYIADASATLWMTRAEKSKEGQRFRRFHELKLGRGQNPAFVLSWTLFHVIDAESRLFGLTAEDMAAGNYQFIVTLKGSDGTATQELRARKSYGYDDLLWGRRYADILTTDKEGVTTLDYRHFHDTVTAEV